MALAPFPRLDERRQSQLREELLAIAASMLPDWEGATSDSEFGRALIEIAARLGEHVTQRIDRTPLRDAAAFYAMLDVPGDAARPAMAPVVFQLAQERPTFVFAPERLRLAAEADSEEIAFETSSALHLTPARPQVLVAADGLNDRVELSPEGFFVLPEDPVVPPPLRVLTFAGQGAKKLQIDPFDSLAERDLLRIAGRVYRVTQPDDGGLAVLESALVTDVLPGTAVEKVTRFDSFSMKDDQAHRLYIGHESLLRLEEKSTITVTVVPPEAADLLASERVRWELYGLDEADPDPEMPAWRPLDADGDGPGQVVLTKGWRGTIAENEEPGQESRWLRASLQGPVSGDSLSGATIRTIRIEVKSDRPSSTQGSDTIDQAFYNNTPLPLTSRFQPFGSEPQRFDTFAIAAPEALSKPGARVTLDVTMPDASVQALTATQMTAGPSRIYAIGANGQLQRLALTTNDLEWQELGAPDIEREGIATRQPLSPATSHAAIQLNKSSGNFDMVAALDEQGRAWARQVAVTDGPPAEFKGLTWKDLGEMAAPDLPRDFVLFRHNHPSLARFHALLLAVHDGTLKGRTLDATLELLEASQDWTELTPVTNQRPALGPNTRISAMLPADWPVSSAGLPGQVLVVDDSEGAIHVWRGRVFNENWVHWEMIIPDVHPLTPAVGILEGNGSATVFAIDALTGRPLIWTESDGATHIVPDMSGFVPSPGSCIEIAPKDLDDEPFGLLVGKVGDAPSIAMVHKPNQLAVRPLPSSLQVGDRTRSAVTLVDDDPVALINGTGETVYRAPFRYRLVGFTRLHALRQTPGANDPYFVALGPNSPNGVGRVLPDPYDASDVPAPLKVITTSEVITASDGVVFAMDASKPLEVGPHDKYEILDSFEGVPGLELNELFLGDASPPAASTLVIADEIYTIDDPSVEPVRLDRAHGLTEATTCHVVYSDLDWVKLDVADSDLGTLLELDGSSPPVSDEFVFFDESGATPQPQRRLLAGHAGGKDYVLLSDAWEQAPPITGRARIARQGDGFWSAVRFERGHRNPELSWEYYDGEGWQRLAATEDQPFEDGTNNFAKSGRVKFEVPGNLRATEIAGKQSMWLRVRLIGGDYGQPRYVVETDYGPPRTQTVTVDRKKMNPPEILRIEAEFEAEPQEAEHVRVQNNLTIRDQSEASKDDHAEFEAFQGVRAINHGKGSQRVLYVGFDRSFELPSMTLYVDAEDQDGKETELCFEVFVNGEWRQIDSNDQTSGFHRRGFVTLVRIEEPEARTLFGRSGSYWMRVRPVDPGDAGWAPRIRGLYVNAVQAEQTLTVEQEVLGSSLGEEGQSFLLSQPPVVPGSLELRVREELGDEEKNRLLEQGADQVVRYEPQSIEGDWVLWREVESFIGLGPDDRVYRLEAAAGMVHFGLQTKVPPPGIDGIRAAQYQTGGGDRGNVGAYAIKGLKSAPESVERVANPVAAAGGTEAPPLADQLEQAPGRLRRRHRVVSPPDIEALVESFSPRIVRARCLFPTGPGEPIRIAVLQKSGDERCPEISLSDRLGVAARVRAQAWGALGSRAIEVVSPTYVHAVVRVRLRPRSSELAAALDNEAASVLRDLFDPVRGGPRGRGWPFGRRPRESDVLKALAPLPHLDRILAVSELAPAPGEPGWDPLPPLALVCAHEQGIDVRLDLDGEED